MPRGRDTLQSHGQQDYSFHKQPSAYRLTQASTTGGSYMVSPWSHGPGLLVFAQRSAKIQLHSKAKRDIYSTVFHHFSHHLNLTPLTMPVRQN
jgi:hypothetical protein